MHLTSGTKLGNYEILGPLGAGGMGEVYKAKDTKLDREVAIKVIPTTMAADRERLARFEREAKVLASLNHPNIAQIYGLEDNALVMELVPGQTLTVPQPLEKALHYAKQIAEALEAAHEKGITHRDLKPANIMITPEGAVKVLDFGLASVPTRETNLDPENSPTMTMAATQAGMIMGTAAYMSPEQAAGKAVDKRSDIWSFGVVLYEMLVGKRLFDGETLSHTLADVLRSPIDFAKLPPHTPAPIIDLTKRCLDRDPRRRLRDIGEARLAIERCLANPGVGDVTSAQKPIRATSKWPLLLAATLALVAAGASWITYHATRSPELKSLVHLDVDLGSDVSLGAAQGTDVILSPDGTRLVYVSKGKLFSRKLDQPKALELAGTEGALAPFFSPDGHWVAFFAQAKLKKLSVEGGEPVVLCDAPGAYGGSWSEDGTIIASLGIQGALSRISAAGGTPTPVAEMTTGEVTQRWPQVLPGGKAVLFTSSPSSGWFEGASIEVMSLNGQNRKMLHRGGMFGRYLPTSNGVGHLVYMANSTLFAVPFDLGALALRGTPVPVLKPVAYNPQTGATQLDFSGASSEPGTLLYRSGDAVNRGQFTVQWLDRTGRLQPMLVKPGRYIHPAFSPDGKRLAVEVTDGPSVDIWIYEWQRDTFTRLTFNAGAGARMNPVWSPDGQYLAFWGKEGMFWTRSDGGGKPQPLTQSRNLESPVSFTPDGKRLAFSALKINGGRAIWTLPVESNGSGLRGGKPEVFLQTARFDERTPTFSPDGRWLAYTSNESGTYQVYVRAFPDKGGQWQISTSGGTYPVWSRSGHELFFRSIDNRIMVVAYSVKGDSLVADQPRLWSDRELPNTGIIGGSNYDVAPDGKRVAVLMPVELPDAQAQHHVVFLGNFFDELRRSVPLDGK